MGSTLYRVCSQDHDHTTSDDRVSDRWWEYKQGKDQPVYGYGKETEARRVLEYLHARRDDGDDLPFTIREMPSGEAFDVRPRGVPLTFQLAESIARTISERRWQQALFTDALIRASGDPDAAHREVTPKMLVDALLRITRQLTALGQRP